MVVRVLIWTSGLRARTRNHCSAILFYRIAIRPELNYRHLTESFKNENNNINFAILRKQQGEFYKFVYVKLLLKLCDDIEMFINIITDVAKRFQGMEKK